MTVRPLTAAVVTVGSELLDGIALDTNTREIAGALTSAGYRVTEAVSIPDDESALAAALARLTAAYALVICTGGLGPTHDDITRQAAAVALQRPLVASSALRAGLEHIADRHVDPAAREQVFVQALVIDGAEVIPATSGTAPGQIVPTASGKLVLLPGPPHEMRPMLEGFLGGTARAPVRILGCVGMSESDAQVIAQTVLAGQSSIDLTVLATPGHVRVVLVDRGADRATLDRAGDAIAEAIGDRCYSSDDADLAGTVLSLAREAHVTLALAESCTGGLVAAELTAVPGSSDAFLGGAVTYANGAKEALLGVSGHTLDTFGAVSAETACEMALGARERFGADLAVAVTGVAGPDGATPEKPVGLVWFGIANEGAVLAVRRNLFGDREGVRERAKVTALDLMRRSLAGLEVG